MKTQGVADREAYVGNKRDGAEENEMKFPWEIRGRYICRQTSGECAKRAK